MNLRMSSAAFVTGNIYMTIIGFIISYVGNAGPDQSGHYFSFNSFPAVGDFCCLLITFANSLDPDQARQNIGPDLDPNCLTLWW